MSAPRLLVDTDIFDELCASMANGRADELTLRRFQRRAEQLKLTDEPEVGWVARAAVAALAWDLDAVESISRRARQVIGHDAQPIANLSVAHRHVNLMEGALEYAREAVALAPANMFCVQQLLGALTLTGRWSEALARARGFVRLVGVDQAGAAAAEVESVMPPRLDWLRRVGVWEEQVQSELREAWAVLREAEVRYVTEGAMLAEDHEGGGETFCLRIQFAGDIEDEVRLAAMLAPRLARLPGWDPTRLSVDFACQREDADAAV